MFQPPCRLQKDLPLCQFWLYNFEEKALDASSWFIRSKALGDYIVRLSTR